MQPEFIDPSRVNQHETPRQCTEETESLLSKSSDSCPGDIPFDEDKAKIATELDSHDVDIRGLALLSHMKFYLLWLLLGLLTSLGIMTINNIGSNVRFPILGSSVDPSYPFPRLERYGTTMTTVPPQNSSKNDN